ncbi:helix-turn-helix transcriptional regulator [Streptomyces sp. NPDC048442]|uniref:helix-turn-helix transcriptional regulator n=1 Tax=Streptomyces sp. NPDC048442 TaxID=3154823 RepID=UPI003415857D
MIPAPSSALTVLQGLDRINAALDAASAACRQEVRTLQPGGIRSESLLTQGLERGRPMLERGVRMRSLYQHTARYGYGLFAYLDRLADARLEVRTLDELVSRLMIFDSEVAFLATTTDNHNALEVREPHLVAHLSGIFDQLWAWAVPLHDPLDDLPASDDDHPTVTQVRRSIARLLVQGQTDEAIAHRLGLHVRTCRAHVAKLSDIFGSATRTQLGYFIAKSNILDDCSHPPKAPAP